MKKLEVRFTRAPHEEWPVGTLAEDRGRVYFEYTPEFLARRLDLSPFRLPFAPGLFAHDDRDFGPLPGLFDDSLPDGWGLLLIDRHLRARGVSPASVGPLDRLSFLGTRTMGALTYHPPVDLIGVDAGLLALHDLARHAQELLAGAAVDVLPQLLRAGGSPGGARPKVLVGFDPGSDRLVAGADDLPAGFAPWIVKLAARGDAPDAGAVEHAYARMADAAGIDVPETRLFVTPEGDRFFGARRFDRGAGNQRRHVHTFGNLIQVNFRVPSADYADLLKATSLLTRDQRHVLQTFRRLVFNVLAHNRDDHVKNFAFVLDEATAEWSPSPAYDLLFTPGPGGEHTMTVAGEGRAPDRPHLLRVAEQAGIARRAALAVIDEVRSAVAGFRRHARRAGVAADTIREIAVALPRLGRRQM